MLKAIKFPNDHHHEDGLAVLVDESIPGYSSVMTVPTVEPPVPKPRHLWVVARDAYDFDSFKRSLGRRPFVFQARCAESLTGISDSDVVILPDAHKRGDWPLFETAIRLLRYWKYGVEVTEVDPRGG